jgi:ABC-type branched-subunit amino acid transport system substrate-binding protein
MEKAIGPKALEGVYVGTGFYWEIEKFHPTAKRFVAAYQTQYNQKPGSYAYNCYAGVHVWADAVRISKTLDGDAIVKVWGSPTFSFDHGKGKVRWKTPHQYAIEEWYICKGRAPADVAAQPDRILDIVQVTGNKEEYLFSSAELGYK